MRWLPAVGAGLLLINLFAARRFFHDDALIELRYAANFLSGGGLAWNPGEPVEGFTSPLHLLLVTLLGGLGISLERAARLVNIAALIGLILVFWTTLRHAGLRSGSVGWGSAWLTLLGAMPLAVWTMSGLEPALVAITLCAAQLPLLAAAEAEIPSATMLTRAGMGFALAVLARPDATAALIAAAGALIAVGPWRMSQKLRACALLLLPAVVVSAGLLAFRLEYFGSALPNTYYAKVYGVALSHRLSLGLDYLFVSSTVLPALPIVPLAALTTSGLAKRKSVMLLTAQVIAAILATVWVGGDHMVDARFLVPAVPLLGLLVGLLLDEQTAPVAVRRVVVLAVLLTVVAGLLVRAPSMDPAAWVGRLVGEYIDKTWPADSLVALNTAGSTPYFAPRLRFLDMLGINDPTIAHRRIISYGSPAQSWPGHAKGDGAYVLARRPDFIIAGFAEGQQASASPFFGDAELAASPKFARCYRLDTAAISYDLAYARLGPERPNPLIFTFYRRVC